MKSFGTTFSQYMRVLNGHTEWRWISEDGTVVSPIFRSAEASHNWARRYGIVHWGYNEPIPIPVILRKFSKRKKKLRLTGQRN